MKSSIRDAVPVGAPLRCPAPSAAAVLRLENRDQMVDRLSTYLSLECGTLSTWTQTFFTPLPGF